MPCVIAIEIERAAFAVLAETFERNQDADRSLGRIEPFCKFLAQYSKFVSIGAHKQVLCVVLEELACLVAVGHLTNPEIGVVNRAGGDYLRQADGTGASHPCLSRRIDALDDQIR